MKKMNYLSIKQVSGITGTPSHTLRYWEKEFEGILEPDRTRGGQRRYSQEAISVIERIKYLKKQGFSLSIIRNKLTQGEETQDQNISSIDLLAEKVSEIVKDEIYNFFQSNNSA